MKDTSSIIKLSVYLLAAVGKGMEILFILFPYLLFTSSRGMVILLLRNLKCLPTPIPSESSLCLKELGHRLNCFSLKDMFKYNLLVPGNVTLL